MTWTDPLLTAFETGDVLSEANFKTYVLDDLFSLEHPLEAPTTSDLDINTSAAETTIYSVVVPANTMGTNGSVRMQLRGDFLYNNSTANTLTFRVKFGGVTFLDDAWSHSALMSNRMPWRMEVEVWNRGSAASQHITGYLQMFSQLSVSAPANGIGDWSSSHSYGGALSSNPAAPPTVATTSNQTLLVSVQWSASSANNSIARRVGRTLIGKN